jgi:hypothetical protein
MANLGMKKKSCNYILLFTFFERERLNTIADKKCFSKFRLNKLFFDIQSEVAGFDFYEFLNFGTKQPFSPQLCRDADYLSHEDGANKADSWQSTVQYDDEIFTAKFWGINENGKAIFRSLPDKKLIKFLAQESCLPETVVIDIIKTIRRLVKN